MLTDLWADVVDRDVEGVDLICELSLISLLPHKHTASLAQLPHRSFFERGAKCHFSSVCLVLKNSYNSYLSWPGDWCFFTLVEPHVGVAAQLIWSLHLSVLFYTPFLMPWCHITPLPDFPKSHWGHVAHLLTFLPLELGVGGILSDIQLRLPAVTLTSHLLQTMCKRRCAV